MNRQISFLLNNFRYFEEETDPNNEGLLIPRYVASGRTDPKGKVYSEVTKKNEDDLVPVRSIITKTSGELYKVGPDLLGKKFLRASFPNESNIGLSSGTSFSEATTQGLLGLKHGGHERVQDTSGNFYAPKDCELREEGTWLILKVRGGKELKYPRPTTWVGLGKTKFSAGELIGSAYNSVTPAYKLNALISMMKARGTLGSKYFEKDNLIVSDCYAYNAGKIEYRDSGKNGIEVWIGSDRYMYTPEAMYYYPEGTEIKKFQRFCSGVVNMGTVTMDLGKDRLSDIFNIFRRQYYSLTSPTYKEYNSPDMYVTSSDMQEEILELIFVGLTKIIRDGAGKIDDIKYLGTQGSILDRSSFFTTISYGWSNKSIQRALRGEVDLEGDAMTETILGLLIDNNLDSKTNNKKF